MAAHKCTYQMYIGATAGGVPEEYDALAVQGQGCATQPHAPQPPPPPHPAPPRPAPHPSSPTPTNPPRSLPTIARVSSWHILDTPPTPPTAPWLPPQPSVLMRSGRGPRGRVLSTHPSLPSRASSSTRRQRPARGTLRGPLSLEAPPTSSRVRTRSAHRPLC